MSKYYNPHRSRNKYNPNSDEPFKISRSKIDLFIECPKCFYIDRRLGTKRPPGYPFSLNSAVDELLKKEFDAHRVEGSKHPLMEEYGIEAVPFKHEMMDEWRNNFKGVQFLHRPTNLLITGALDDIWVDDDGNLIVVDYKVTSKKDEVSLDADWQISYKRQVEIYQWLLIQNGFDVSDTTYFVYCNGDADAEAFDGKIEFDVKVIPYEGDSGWVEGKIEEIHKCLRADEIPESGEDCDYCAYREAVDSHM